jgi:hypothetical protein
MRGGFEGNWILSFQDVGTMAQDKDAEKSKDLAPLVELHYPEPTPLGIIVKEVAIWSKLVFVMEPTANYKIQIFAPRKMRPEDAYEAFLVSLSLVGLRAVRKGDIVKIVPSQVVVTA